MNWSTDTSLMSCGQMETGMKTVLTGMPPSFWPGCIMKGNYIYPLIIQVKGHGNMHMIMLAKLSQVL